MEAVPSHVRIIGGGRFELRGELGRGGMGIVYRALDLTTDREVALKVVQQAFTDPESRARFDREGQLTAALRHPNIVAVHSAGEVEGRPFISYELVPGARPLDRVLDELDLRARVALVRDVARALGHAHAHGVIHRDVKPANVLVDHEGRPRVSDFGLATAAGLGRLTQTGEVLGTPSYMSPEQLSGEYAITPATDVWALGGILYRALTDEPPFAGTSFFQLAGRVLSGGPPRPPSAINPSVPPAIEAVCVAALRRDPAERPRDGEELARLLDEALAGRGAQPRRRSKATVALALAALGAVVLAVAAVALAPRPADPRPGGDRPVGRVPKTTAATTRPPPPPAVVASPPPVTAALHEPRPPAGLDQELRERLESADDVEVMAAFQIVMGQLEDPHARAYALRCAGRVDPENDADLGKLYLDGAPGFERNVDAARHWLERAVARGAYHTAPKTLADLYLQGPPELRDVERGILLARLAVEEADSRGAEKLLGAIYSDPDFKDRDYAEAARWFGRNARTGDREGARHLESLLVRGLIPEDDPNLRQEPFTVPVPAGFPRELCDLLASGDVAAIAARAEELADRDPRQAAPLLARAFAGGHTNSGLLLGKKLLEPALGSDHDAALETTLRAVAQGAPTVTLERMRRYSLGLLKDPLRARFWARFAAAQPKPPAEVLKLLGDLLLGEPVRDGRGARRAYERAVTEHGDAEAKLELDAMKD